MSKNPISQAKKSSQESYYSSYMDKKSILITKISKFSQNREAGANRMITLFLHLKEVDLTYIFTTTLSFVTFIRKEKGSARNLFGELKGNGNLYSFGVLRNKHTRNVKRLGRQRQMI